MAITLDPWGLLDDEVYLSLPKYSCSDHHECSPNKHSCEQFVQPTQYDCDCGNCFDCVLASPENNYCQACEYGVCSHHEGGMLNV